MLFGLMIAAFWIIGIGTLIWIFTKSKLRKKHSLFSIIFAALAMGIIAAVFILIAYLAIVIFLIIAILVVIGFVINFLFTGKRKK